MIILPYQNENLWRGLLHSQQLKRNNNYDYAKYKIFFIIFKFFFFKKFYK